MHGRRAKQNFFFSILLLARSLRSPKNSAEATKFLRETEAKPLRLELRSDASGESASNLVAGLLKPRFT